MKRAESVILRNGGRLGMALFILKGTVKKDAGIND